MGYFAWFLGGFTLGLIVEGVLIRLLWIVMRRPDLHGAFDEACEIEREARDAVTVAGVVDATSLRVGAGSEVRVRAPHTQSVVRVIG